MSSDSFAAFLAKPAQRALEEAGITSLQQLSTMTEAEVMALHGMGANAMVKLRTAMQAVGVEFAKER